MVKKLSKREQLNLEIQNQERMSVSQTHILSVDYGTKFTGLAFSPDGMVILPLQVVRTSELDTVLSHVVPAREIQHLLFGLPLSVSGKENTLCLKIRKIAESYAQKYGVEGHFVNEQYSSKAFENNTETRIDDLAAAKILEFYLSQKN